MPWGPVPARRPSPGRWRRKAPRPRRIVCVSSQEPPPQVCPVRGQAFVAVELQVQLALFQGFNLFVSQRDRGGERAAGGFGYRQVSHGLAARAFGHTLVQARDGGRAAKALEG